MRVFLNGILSFIGSESLTDEEFDSLTITQQNYSTATYEALRGVLQSREMVSGQLRKLKAYFRIKGADVGSEKATPAVSNIFVGASLG